MRECLRAARWQDGFSADGLNNKKTSPGVARQERREKERLSSGMAAQTGERHIGTEFRQEFL
jgi:hypothetical protein